jgi:hypothetical protein
MNDRNLPTALDSQESSKLTCTFNFERLQAAKPIKSDIDEEFPPRSTSLFWEKWQSQ